MPVLLWTDGLVFLLLAGAVAFGLYARTREHLRAPWREVARSGIAMASAVVLALFIGVGLLDSLHYHPRLPAPASATRQLRTPPPRYATEVVSVLDLILAPLRAGIEKSYSAPFATHLFTKEPIEQPDGTERRDYPRLAYGGQHLRDPGRDRGLDVLRRAGRGALDGLLLTLVGGAALIALLASRRRQSFSMTALSVINGTTPVPWRVILLSGGVLLLLICTSARLSAHYHVLGTDKVGQDVLYLAIKSIRTGLVIGTLTTLITLPIAIVLGISAGYFRGWIDDAIQYVYTTLNSIPGVLLIAAAILLLQVYMTHHAEAFESIAMRADMRLLFLCIILGMTSWTGLCRLLRAETLKLREMEYVQAAQALGVRSARIVSRHLLPNVMHIVLISVVLDFSHLVLAEAVLSYINIGVDPSTISWGNMINSARLEMAREPVVWWSLAAAFAFMFALVLAANLFADAVRDAFDPRLRGKS